MIATEIEEVVLEGEIKPALFRVDVTQDDIDHGCEQVPNRCPIALALKRMGYKNVSVVSHAVRWATKYLDPGSPVYAVRKLPDEAAKFVQDFDLDREVKPFSFWLETSIFEKAKYE